MQDAGFRVQGSGSWWRLRRKYIWGDARRFAGSRFPSYRQPSPRGENKEEATSPPKKEATPASLRSTAPSKGRG